jgi:uncharacterized membrane protein
LPGCSTCPGLFIYATEAGDKASPKKHPAQQFSVMMKRLWYGITWPSAILTLVLGPVVMFRAAGINFFSNPKAGGF